MATAEPQLQPAEQVIDKGLKSGALGLVSRRTTTRCGPCRLSTGRPVIHWQIGGAFIIAVAAAIIGLICYLYCRFSNPAFVKRQTLTRQTATLVPDD